MKLLIDTLCIVAVLQILIDNCVGRPGRTEPDPLEESVLRRGYRAVPYRSEVVRPGDGQIHKQCRPGEPAGKRGRGVCAEPVRILRGQSFGGADSGEHVPAGV